MAVPVVALNDLSPDVRSFLTRFGDDGGVLVEDRAGRVKYGVIRLYAEASSRRQAAALKRLAMCKTRLAR